MSDEIDLEESVPAPVARSKKPAKRKKLTPEQEAYAVKQLATAEEHERLGRGKRLTRVQRSELISNIRMGLANAMHPAALRSACMQKFNLTRHTVDRYLLHVQQEQIKEVGYYRHQIQDLCQKALVEIVKKKGASEGAVVRAVQMLDNIFDIRVVPEDTAEAQRLIAEDAMAKMDKMNVQELQQFTEHLRQGGDRLTPEMLMPWNATGDADDRHTPRNIKSERRRKNRRDLK